MGGKDLAAAQDLALVLRAVRSRCRSELPISAASSEPRSGLDQQGDATAIIAVALVVLVMVVYYRLSVARGRLARLLLPSLRSRSRAVSTPCSRPLHRGFVLSIGIAGDANVLIFERIREELDAERRSARDR